MAPYLIGFGDFPEAYVGAAAKPKVAAKTSSKKPAKAVKSTKVSPHKTAMVNAINAGKKALAAGKKAHASAAAYKPAAHAPLVKLAASVSPKGTVLLGVAPAPGKKPLTAAANAAVARHANAIARGAAANKNLSIAASKATKAGNASLAFVKAATPFLKKALSGAPKRTVLGVEYDYEAQALVGLLDEVLGVDASGLSPGQPGYDPSTDPNAQGYGGYDPNAPSYDPTQGAMPTGGGGLDPSTGIVTAPDGSVLYDPSQDPQVLPLPARGGKLSQSDANIQWANVPDDGIPYDGSKGFPDRSVGSYNAFYGLPGAQNGYVIHGDGKWWLEQGGDNFDQRAPQPPTYGGDQGLGPLIGNPTGALAGLQWATVDKKWFWQSANAPVSATTEVDAKITEANQKTVAANTAAALAQLAQMQKDAADIAEQQAKQDAQNALAQSQAQAEQQVAQTRADTADIAAQQSQAAQQAQQDIEYQKMQDAQEAAQGQADIERQKAELAMEAEAQHALVAQSAAYNEWAKAHPEEAFAAKQQTDAEDAQGGDVSDDGGQSMGPTPQEAPSMFEEGAQPQGDDDVDQNWPREDV